MKTACPCALIFASLIVLSITAAGCDDDPAVVRPPDDGSSLSGNLQSHCYSWPEQEFSPKNIAALEAALPVGSSAVEFSLEDLEGNARQLSALLKSKPVLLVLGAYT